MVKRDWNIVDFTEGPVSGRLAAQAEADIDAKIDLRRGIGFSEQSHARIEGSLKGTLASADPKDAATATASITASIGTSQRNAFAAQYGVNLPWAEARATAEARARISGDIIVTGAILADALKDHTLRNDVDLAAALLPALAQLRKLSCTPHCSPKFTSRSGLVARYMVIGSVIPQEGSEEEAGLVIKFDYGYAYFWGAGVSGKLNFDLPDAGRVLPVIANSVVDEADRLPPSYTPREIHSLLRMVLPLAAVSSSMTPVSPAATTATRAPITPTVTATTLRGHRSHATRARSAKSPNRRHGHPPSPRNPGRVHPQYTGLRASTPNRAPSLGQRTTRRVVARG